jgi:hypothetical protein
MGQVYAARINASESGGLVRVAEKPVATRISQNGQIGYISKFRSRGVGHPLSRAADELDGMLRDWMGKPTSQTRDVGPAFALIFGRLGFTELFVA